MDERIARIWEFYKKVNPLKIKTRTGWKDWGITQQEDMQSRGESIADHSNSAAWLAFAIKSEYPKEYKDIDMFRVVAMLNFHELDEAVIPDFTPFSDISKEEKRKLSKDAVERTASVLTAGNLLIELIEEFENKSTTAGKFAKQVDSLDAGMQCKIYEEQGLINLTSPIAQKMLKVHNVAKRGHESLADSWLEYCAQEYNYDPVFKSIANQLQVTRTKKLGELKNALTHVLDQKSH